MTLHFLVFSVVFCAQLGGSWSPSVLSVSCELVVCGKPPPLLHGVTEGDSFNYGDFVMYSCLPGFSMKVQPIRPGVGEQGGSHKAIWLEEMNFNDFFLSGNHRNTFNADR